MFVAGGTFPSATNINRSITPIKKDDVMEHTENPPMRVVVSANFCQAQTKFVHSIDTKLDDS